MDTCKANLSHSHPRAFTALGTRMNSTCTTNVHRLLNHASFIATEEITGGQEAGGLDKS